MSNYRRRMRILREGKQAGRSTRRMYSMIPEADLILAAHRGPPCLAAGPPEAGRAEILEH